MVKHMWGTGYVHTFSGGAGRLTSSTRLAAAAGLLAGADLQNEAERSLVKRAAHVTMQPY
jgi:hypothetical protein